MLRISQLKLPVEHTEAQLKKKLLKTAHIKEQDLKQFFIRKRSVDGRKKPELYYVYTVDLIVANEEHVKKISKGKLQTVQEKNYHIPEHGAKKLRKRPVVIGSGPAGLFCAYLLAFEGYEPLVIERGAPVRERQKVVEQFWKDGILNTASNVQFGEGGAGTFSDGKLNTLVKDKFGRNRFVLETFVKFGAPEEILWESKPHIGTDILIEVVERMREEIIRLGGEFLFHSQVTDILPKENCLIVNGCHRIETDAAVFAVGHSARDTFEMLYERQIPMAAKSFAVGMRVEHPQEMINHSQYGTDADMSLLPTATYKLTHQASNGRGVYSFCMCPGGFVVNASSEPQRLAVNGMSYRKRDSHNANSAIIVSVTPEDYPDGSHPLSGVAFQRDLEEKAWNLAKGKVPQQLFGDFEQGKVSTGYGSFESCVKGQHDFANLREIFPEALNEAFCEGMHAYGRKIVGFDRADCILSGVESRTSSPVRIHRDACFQSEIRGLYPCGEGAGYAGGIMSAAMDGLKVAEAVIQQEMK